MQSVLVRPYRIGKKKVSQEEFDEEVKRLALLGLEVNQIASQMRRDRTTVYRSLQRSDLSAQEKKQAKDLKEWKKLSTDEFYQLPEIEKWTVDLKARRVKNWRSQVSMIKKISDSLQIYPSQLDLHYSKNYLATQEDLTLNQLRATKTNLRVWLKYAHRVTDNELTTAGLDAKHYDLRQYAHIKLQRSIIDQIQIDISDDVQTAFTWSFGIDTCSRFNEIKNMKLEYFEDRGNVITCRIQTSKTEKSGQGIAKGWVRRQTYELAKKALPLTNGDMERIRKRLQDEYKKYAPNESYFLEHTFHAMRHCGAQRYLEIFKRNLQLVAKYGHWMGTKTLEDYYGGVDDDYAESSFIESVAS